jgi:hypothetical protein
LPLSAKDRENILELLIEEKKLVYQEKLQIIKTIKGIISLLVPFLTLLVAIAEKEQAHALYIVVPFATTSIAFYLLSNLHTLNLISEYLDRLDKYTLNKLNYSLPLFQIVVGEMLAESGPYLFKKKGQLNPYMLFSIVLVLLTTCICAWSIIQGNYFIVYEIKYYYWNYVFNLSSILSIIYAVYSFIRYGLKFKSLRDKLFDEKMLEYDSQQINNQPQRHWNKKKVT